MSHKQSYSVLSLVSTEMDDVCHQSLGPTQPPTLCGMGNEYWSGDSGSAVRLERSGITLALHCRFCVTCNYGLSGPRKGNQHHSYAPVGV